MRNAQAVSDKFIFLPMKRLTWWTKVHRSKRRECNACVTMKGRSLINFE
jgi:hypothetical protein